MELTIKTKYSHALIKAFARFQLFKGRLSRIMAGLFPSFLAFIVAAVFLNLISGDFRILDLLLLLSAGTAFAAYMISFFLYPSLVYKKHIAVFGETTNEFFFSEDVLVVCAVSDRYSGKSELRIRDLKTAYETRDYIYLYINSLQAFVIGRADIGEEEMDTLRFLLRKALGNRRYILCR